MKIRIHGLRQAESGEGNWIDLTVQDADPEVRETVGKALEALDQARAVMRDQAEALQDQEKVLSRVLQEKDALAQNLGATQARCTALLLWVREHRTLLRNMGYVLPEE